MGVVKSKLRMVKQNFYRYKHRLNIFKIVNKLIVRYLTAAHLIFFLKKELKLGDLRKAIHFLNKSYPFFKPKAVRFLIFLYEYLLHLKISFSLKKNEKQLFIVHFCCWGEAYSEKALCYLLPSLLAPGNLPSISKKYEVILFIHCDSKTKQDLDNAQVLQSLQKYATLNIIVFPEKLFSLYQSTTNNPDFLFFKLVNRVNKNLRYLLLGALQGHALSECLRLNALVSFLIPDSILSESFFSHAISKIKNKKLILTSTFRTDYNGIREHLNQYYTDTNRTIFAISGEVLAKLQVEYLHHTDRRRTISPTTNHFLASARFIFKANNGLILRALHYHPMIIDCLKLEANLKIDYFPIDDSMLKQILVDSSPYENQAWLCSNPVEMNFMELSGEDPEVNEPPVFAAPSTYSSLINAVYLLLKAGAHDLDEKLNRFFICNKLTFVADENYHQDDEVINSDIFVSDLYKRLDDHRIR